jgi:hypothetical protein
MSDLLFDTRIPERIWNKIIPEPNSGCWFWLGSLSGSSDLGGYGETWFNNAKAIIHRLMYEKFIGPIPDKMELDHKCRVRCCCNPMHVEPVTHRGNALRGNAGLNRIIECREALTCDRGHPWTPENTIANSGWRACKACRRARQRWYRAGKVGKVEDYE